MTETAKTENQRIGELRPAASIAPSLPSRDPAREGTLARDSLVRVAVALLGLASLPYLIPVFGDDWMWSFGALYIDLPFLTLVIVVIRRRLRGVTDNNQRRFWSLLSLAFTFWLGLEFLNVAFAYMTTYFGGRPKPADHAFCPFLLSSWPLAPATTHLVQVLPAPPYLRWRSLSFTSAYIASGGPSRPSSRSGSCWSCC